MNDNHPERAGEQHNWKACSPASLAGCLAENCSEPVAVVALPGPRQLEVDRPKMIFLVAPRGDTWPFEHYLQSCGKELSRRLRIVTCEEIAARQELPLGSYIFVALDQMTPTEKEIAVQCWVKLNEIGPNITLVNDPSKVLLRYDFLKACFEGGRNRYRVYRAEGLHDCGHFPVFLRRELDHDGSLGDLLHGPRDLERAMAQKTLDGFRLRDLIVVEHCDTADRAGIYRKYSAFIVGETIIPHTLMHSRHWITKSHGRLIDAGTASEELEYVTTNPHGEWLRETFALANIRYGRIDYGVHNGTPQVWEINTNPTIIRHPDADPLTADQIRLRDPIRHNFFPKFQAALEAIDTTADPHRTIRVEFSVHQRRRIAIERRLRKRLKARRRRAAWMADLITGRLWRRDKR